MKAGSEKAVAAMQAITEVTEETYNDIEVLLGRVGKTYDKIKDTYRMPMTSVTDAFKDYAMTFERPLDPNSKTSEYTRVRNLLVKFKQDQLEAKKRVEAEAAKKKQRSDHFVDIEATIKKNLTEMVVRVANETEEKSAQFFSKLTLENFDTESGRYLKMKPNLKQADYDDCFNVSIRRDLYTEAEAADIIKSFKEALPMAEWNNQMIELATPIVNAWRAKIPDLRAGLVALQAASAEERVRLEAEQKRKAEEEAERRKKELDAQASAAQANIASQAQLGKLENSFVEQATVQQAGEDGPTKLVLKFSDPKTTPKALMEIIYHCMAHPKFGGIQKKDRSGKLQFDEQNRPIYIDEIQKWITFFLANCDVEVAGTLITEDAKIAIRK